MNTRMNIFKVAPDAAKAVLALDATANDSDLDHGLLELVRLRASQINGCAFCIHMHVRDAVKNGDTNMRIHMLDAWRESPLFSDRERAALNWTEVLTMVATTRAPDADYEQLKAVFTETEIAYLTVSISSINVWNRIQVGLRMVHQVGEDDLPAVRSV